MSVTVVYREQSEHARAVTEFMHDYERRSTVPLETIDPDSIKGNDFCRIYDIVEYPTIIAMRVDGQVKAMWRGTPLPAVDEVSSYAE